MSDQFSPQAQPESDADDSMQLKRDRLGVTEEQAITEEHHLGYVDRLLRSAPVLSAPLGFAEKVIARLKAAPPRVPRYEEGTGIVLGLSAAAFLTIPVLATLVVILGVGLFNEDVRNSTWDFVSDVADDAVDAIATIPQDYPVLFALMIVVAVLFIGASGYFVWFWRGLIRTARRLRHE